MKAPALTSKDTRELIQVLGADFEDVGEVLARKLEISGGVKVKKLYPRKLRKYTQMKEGFVITRVDGQAVRSTQELVDILKDKKGGLMLEGGMKIFLATITMHLVYDFKNA